MEEGEEPDVGAQQSLGMYNLEEDMQHAVLELFDGLTSVQQQEMLKQLRAYKKANEAIMRELGGRPRTLSSEKAAKHLPKPPDDHRDEE